MIRCCIALLFSVYLCSAAPPAGSFRQVQAVPAAGGGPDIAFRSAQFAGAASGTDLTITEPAGAAQNDIMVCFFLVAAAGTPGAPTGWLVLTNGLQGFDGLFDYHISVIRRGASAPSLTWTTGGSFYREGQIICISGASTAGTALDAVEVMAKANGNGGANSNPDPPSVTTATANDLVIAGGMNWSGSGGGGWVAQSGYTIRSDNTPGNVIVVSTRTALVNPAGAEDPAIYTGGPAPGASWESFTYAVKD